MNGEQLGPLVSSWLKEEHRPPSDPTVSVQAAMKAATKTRQLRRRWWIPPFVHRLPDPPSRPHAVAHTTDYQPSPIPATNGHTPTVIGRTQSMLSPVKAITAGALVFALGGAFLIAQPFAQQGSVPGATTESELMQPAVVDGDFTAFGSGSRLSITVDASDPRLQTSGVLDTSGWRQESDDPEAEVDEIAFGTWQLSNDEGGWIGTGADVELDYDATVLELDGLGAYEGLTASLLMQWRGSGFSFVGAIVPSDLFPAAETTLTE